MCLFSSNNISWLCGLTLNSLINRYFCSFIVFKKKSSLPAVFHVIAKKNPPGICSIFLIRMYILCTTYLCTIFWKDDFLYNHHHPFDPLQYCKKVQKYKQFFMTIFKTWANQDRYAVHTKVGLQTDFRGAIIEFF